MADATIKEVYNFFADGHPDYKLGMFQKDWKELSDSDKAQIKAGIGNGSLTY